MVDFTHLQKLMEGVAAWNQWRSEHPDVSIDLSSADLRDVELPGANLREANLAACNLREAVLDNADLSSANLQSGHLKGARLRTASLSGANLRGAEFIEVDASGANFGAAELSGCRFEHAKLVGANLSKAICKDSRFIEAELNHSDLTQTDFRDSNLEKAQFVEASLEGADLRRCILGHASFKSANLSRADLRRADFVSADLTDAKLTHADLREVRGLSCDQLTQAQDWEAAYRDAELACDAAIPDPDQGVIIEVPTARFSLTGHPPTVTVTGEIDEALPVTAAKTVPIGIAEEIDRALPITAVKTVSVGTAEEIDEATRQRFNETPVTVVAEARRARDTTIALQTILRDMRLNSPEAGQAQVLLEKQVNALDDIVAMLEPDGDKEAARKTLRDRLYDVLESYLKVLADGGVTKGILAAAAIALLSVAGVDISIIVVALVAGPIVGLEVKALRKILSEWKKKKDEGE